jgi:DNA-binding NtrC family response regulator
MLSHERRSVLVVEDEEEIRKMLVEKIQSMDINVDSAANGKIALELIKNKSYNAILFDLKMPVMNGIKMLTEIRRQGLVIPCIALTSEENLEILQQAMRLGAADFLQKFDFMDTIDETVQRAIEIGYHENKIIEELKKQSSELFDFVQNERKMIWLMRIVNNIENKNK